MTKPDVNSPGGRIRVLRLAHGLTQQALADAVYVTQSAVAQWETNRWVPSRQSQMLIAERLGTTRFFLFGDQAA